MDVGKTDNHPMKQEITAKKSNPAGDDGRARHQNIRVAMTTNKQLGGNDRQTLEGNRRQEDTETGRSEEEMRYVNLL